MNWTIDVFVFFSNVFQFTCGEPLSVTCQSDIFFAVFHRYGPIHVDVGIGEAKRSRAAFSFPETEGTSEDRTSELPARQPPQECDLEVSCLLRSGVKMG